MPGKDNAMWENHIDKTANNNGTAACNMKEDMSHRCYNFLVEFLRS